VIESWSQTATAEQDIKAGPVVSDGVPGTQRVVFGTDADDLHVQMLSNGIEVGPQAGHDIDDGAPDGNTFGALDAVVSPVIASSPSAPGQVYALHNDDDQGGGRKTSRSRKSTSSPAPSCRTVRCPGPTATRFRARRY
jgi:hypothetical protein